MPILHPQEPCRDQAAPEARIQLQERRSHEHSGGQEDSAVSGTDPKGAHRTLQWIPVGHPAPCPAGPAPAAINVGP